jgi:hypothetical protein
MKPQEVTIVYILPLSFAPCPLLYHLKIYKNSASRVEEKVTLSFQVEVDETAKGI